MFVFIQARFIHDHHSCVHSKQAREVGSNHRTSNRVGNIECSSLFSSFRYCRSWWPMKERRPSHHLLLRLREAWEHAGWTVVLWTMDGELIEWSAILKSTRRICFLSVWNDRWNHVLTKEPSTADSNVVRDDCLDRADTTLLPHWIKCLKIEGEASRLRRALFMGFLWVRVRRKEGTQKGLLIKVKIKKMFGEAQAFRICDFGLELEGWQISTLTRRGP